MEGQKYCHMCLSPVEITHEARGGYSVAVWSCPHHGEIAITFSGDVEKYQRFAVRPQQIKAVSEVTRRCRVCKEEFRTANPRYRYCQKPGCQDVLRAHLPCKQ